MELVDYDLLDDCVPTLVGGLSKPEIRPITNNEEMFSTVDWVRLRNYVVDQIVATTGPFPRNPQVESGIFKGFIARWGDKAMVIARHAFEVYGGYWNNAPIRVNRFAKNNDPYFAEVIAAKL